VAGEQWRYAKNPGGIDNCRGLATGICQRTDYRMRSISILAILLLAATPAVAEQAPPQVCFTPAATAPIWS